MEGWNFEDAFSRGPERCMTVVLLGLSPVHQGDFIISGLFFFNLSQTPTNETAPHQTPLNTTSHKAAILAVPFVGRVWV